MSTLYAQLVPPRPPSPAFLALLAALAEYGEGYAGQHAQNADVDVRSAWKILRRMLALGVVTDDGGRRAVARAPGVYYAITPLGRQLAAELAGGRS